MSLVKHAEIELEAAGLMSDTVYDGMIGKGVLEIVKLFASQGHSGMSAGISIDILTKLLAYKPLSPLTGNDSEWVEVGEGVFQNNRCGNVFKQADRFNGQAYDINAVVFEEPNGCRFTNSDSFRPITFPYTPTREIVKVDECAR